MGGKNTERTAASLTLQRCRMREYREMLRFLDRSFSARTTFMFEKGMGHIFRPKEKYVRNNYICRVDGEIAGAIGIYPFDLRIGKAVLKVGGVGSVSVDPSRRGSGIMSSMLRQVNEKLADGDFDISWLSGARFRYRNYGWDLAGKTAVFSINRKDLERYHETYDTIRMIDTSKVPIDAMMKAYSRFYSTVVRDKSLFSVQLNRKKYHWRAGKTAHGFAYFAVETWAPENVLEIQGDPPAVISLLNEHFKEFDKWEIRIHYPCDDQDPLFTLFHSICGDFSMRCNRQLEIVHVDSTWEKLLPELHQWTKGKSVDIDFEKVADTADRKMLLERALGFFNGVPSLPPRLARFDALQPVPWWLSYVDYV
jgi:predicted N-acetyltransferase YhbS